MKIKANSPKLVRLDSLKAGETFSWNGNLCIVLNTAVYEAALGRSNGAVRFAMLHSGRMDGLSGDTWVTPINAEAVYEG